MQKTMIWIPRMKTSSAALVPEVAKECTTGVPAEPAAELAPPTPSVTTVAGRTTSTSDTAPDRKMTDGPCDGCRHTKNRWRTWRLIPYCVRYRTERNVKCLMYKSKEKANG